MLPITNWALEIGTGNIGNTGNIPTKESIYEE